MNYFLVHLNGAFFIKEEQEFPDIFWLEDEQFGVIHPRIAIGNIKYLKDDITSVGVISNDFGVSYKLDFIIVASFLNKDEFSNYILQNSPFILSCFKYSAMQFGFPNRINSYGIRKINLEHRTFEVKWDEFQSIAARDFVADAICLADMKEAQKLYQKQEIPGQLLLLVDSLEGLFVNGDYVKSMIYGILCFEAIVKHALKTKMEELPNLLEGDVKEVFKRRLEEQLDKSSSEFLGKSLKTDHRNTYDKILDLYKNERNPFLHIGRSNLLAPIDDYEKFDKIFSILDLCFELGKYYDAYRKYPSFNKSYKHSYYSGVIY